MLTLSTSVFSCSPRLEKDWRRTLDDRSTFDLALLDPATGVTPLAHPHADSWLDQFFEAYLRRRPVNATFIGDHRFDARLPGLSESAAGDTLAEMQRLLATTPASGTIDDPVRSTDVRLATGFLRTQIWEFESRHFHRGNPSLYTGEAVFGVASLLLTDFAPLPQRVDRVIDRLHEIPRFLAEGRANIREAPATWIERAIRECDGAHALLRTGLGYVGADVPKLADALSESADAADAAFAIHRDHLVASLPSASDIGVACGEEALSLYIREGHLLSESLEEILERARAELADASARLHEGAADLGASSPQEALHRLRNQHPSAAEYYGRYEEVWREMRQFAIDRDLLTWPNFPIRFRPRPDWAREAAPHLYFLFYRSPAAFDRPPVHDYLVTPIDESLDAERQDELLQATNDGVIKLNHVLHHGGIGHHVQNWHAFRSSSRVGRIAAVDCASRIAMFCGGTMAEGWACYATDLMKEAGALTPLEEYSEIESRVRMCSRAVVDILLHSGRLDLEGAAEFYQTEAGFPAASARAEAVKNSMFPGAALMYQVGTDDIHRLRRDLERRRGADFDLREFHDEFLSYGSVPVRLVCDSMRGRDAE
jgi:hypothetical protein